MRIRVVDAFTERAFAGNPAGVCVLGAGDWPDDSWMQSVAKEMQHAETAFTRPSATPGADWDLRWFTPAIEVDMCGHATLATTHALIADGLVTDHVRFSTRSGILSASADAGRITLDFPISPVAPIDVPDGLVEALGVKPDEVYGTGPLTDVLVVLSDEDAVRAVSPDLVRLEAINRRDRNRGTIVTAPADAEYDFVSRFFAPVAGIPEDPVCGSAHTALASYWSERLGRSDLVGHQVSARGGVLQVTAAGDRVHLGGSAVTVLDGELLV
ncbi:PhzF family phenazine biosynthesis protein [Kribbella sp. NPDC004875]|uniref:PhzF family phenazine biosynthesis protein n=1 Tax=Kribbella sp. NPDC004875 TaxID=3364107 RepID=UPI003688EB63